MSAAGRVADSTGNWVDRRAPAWARPYLRLARADRPIGSWLLLLPCWWSAALAADHAGAATPDPWHLVLFAIGTVAMRGAGCTWNDLVDRDLDGRVERTRSRPIPSGDVSVGAARGFLVLQALIGIKSTALLFGTRTKPVLAAFYAAAVLLIGLAGLFAGAGLVFAAGLALFAAHLTWQVRRLDIADPALCLAVFKSNRDAGLVLFAAIVLDGLVRQGW